MKSLYFFKFYHICQICLQQCNNEGTLCSKLERFYPWLSNFLLLSTKPLKSFNFISRDVKEKEEDEKEVLKIRRFRVGTKIEKKRKIGGGIFSQQEKKEREKEKRKGREDKR